MICTGDTTDVTRWRIRSGHPRPSSVVMAVSPVKPPRVITSAEGRERTHGGTTRLHRAEDRRGDAGC